MTDRNQKPNLVLSVRGEDAVDADAPLFANFVGIAHQGTEVQFEFIFLDFNLVAKLADKLNAGSLEKEDADVQGRTVAKIVVPVANFVQLREHLNGMFRKFEDLSNAAAEEEAGPERKTAKGE